MAARIEGASDRLYLDEPGVPTSLTMCAWIFVDSERAYSYPLGFDDDAGNGWLLVGFGGDPGELEFSATNGHLSSGFDPQEGGWYFACATWQQSDNAAALYYAAEGATTVVVGDTGTIQPFGTSSFNFSLGSDSVGEYMDGRVAHARVWSAVLSQSEIEAEMLSASPVRTADLWGAWALDGDTNDSSGNGRNLTETSTVTYVDGPSSLSTPPVTFVDEVGIVTGGQYNDVTVTNPAILNAGDLMLVAITKYDAGSEEDPTAVPSGWELLGKVGPTTGNQSMVLRIYWHIATENEPSSRVWEFAENPYTVWQMVTFSGAADAAPAIGAFAGTGSAASGSQDVPSVTATADGSRRVMFFSGYDNGMGAPTGWTERRRDDGVCIAVTKDDLDSAGATGTQTITLSGATGFTAVQISIAPPTPEPSPTSTMYVGDTPVSGIYAGDTPIAAVYLGDDLAWSNS